MQKVRLIGLMGILLLLLSGFFTCVSAATIVGGDADDLASADVLLDIAFVIDTSASMNDEASTISSIMGDVARNIDCPDCDVWVRADFFGIGGTWGSSSLFDTNMSVIGSPLTTNSNEDNAPAVYDMITYASYWSSDDRVDTTTQDYYRAIVTIGDEGTDNGYPVTEADWAEAYAANQLAITNNFFVFSLAGTPYYPSDADNMRAVFEALAVGGTGYDYTLGDTGGTFANTTSETLQADIERIICTAAGGGTGGGTEPVPEPGTILLMGVGLAGLAASRLRKKRS